MAVFGSSGRRWISDPSEFPLWSAIAANFTIPTTDASSTANFFTGTVGSVDRYGTDVDSNWTLNTYKTLLNLTATKAGFLSTIVGPTMTTAADTMTLRITVDGAQYVLTPGVAQQNASRIIVGSIFKDTFLSGSSGWTGQYAGVSSDGITLSAGSLSLPQTFTMWNLGAPILRFTSSLLVEAKISTNLTTTTNQERRCGVIYLRTA